ncbi:MAG: helix-turn-helix domain-containing protein [Planctomycetota bacterium]
MPPKPTARKRLRADERRAQLLETATALFASRGYARTTTAELAKAAGVTEPVIYRHFDSKRDLFVALIEQTAERTLSIWRTALDQAESPTQRLEILLASNPMVALGDEEALAYRIILQSITETDDAAIHAAVSDHFESIHTFVLSEIAAAQAGGQVKHSVEPPLVAWALIEIALGFGVLSAMGVRAHERAAGTTSGTIGLIRGALLTRPK